MNIFLVITGLGMGGAEKQVCLLADKFKSKGHMVTLVSLTGKSIVTPKHNNVKLIELNMHKNPFSIFMCYFRLRNIIKSINPDVVHSHMFHANIFVRIVRLTTKIKKLVCTAHSTNEGGELRALIYRVTDKLSDLNTNVSKEAVDIFISKKAFDCQQSIVMYNGIDTDIFKAKEKNKGLLDININKFDMVFSSIGRLTEAKDYPNLFKALDILNKKSINFCMLIVGEGEIENDLKLMVRDLGLESRVYFLGRRNDIADILSLSDIFILSSAWEGFCLVVLEAMSCEKIVVATDSGGVKEALSDCGSIVPIKDSQALSKSILDMLNLSSAEKYDLQKRSRARIISNFSINSIVNKWLCIYRSK